MEGYLKWKGFGYFFLSQEGVWTSFHHPASRVYFLVKSVTHTWFSKQFSVFNFMSEKIATAVALHTIASK